jgi:hypothetical protein
LIISQKKIVAGRKARPQPGPAELKIGLASSSQ